VFGDLTEKLTNVFDTVRSRGKLTEENIGQACDSVRKALIEADVNFTIVKDFISRVREQALGEQKVKKIKAGDYFIKIVSDELTSLLGEGNAEIPFVKDGPTIIMMCGLQGSGKTTTVGKLAYKLKNEGRKPLLVAADIQRPAAIEQLHVLGEQVGVPVFSKQNSTPPEICIEALAVAKSENADVIILDTAGRLHVDEELMNELHLINKKVKPHQTYLVVDAMIGQDAVNSAKEFNDRLELDGLILTKLDGDSRGGAAISIRHVTGKTIKFVGMGEKLDALESFYPDRLASRILGMGDIVGLVEKAESAIEEADAKKLEEKILKNNFDFNDFLKQLQMLKKMGSIKDLLGMIPGIGKAMKGVDVDPKQFLVIEAIIQSMTNKERLVPELIENQVSRRKRIAKGCGQTMQMVTNLLKQFKQMKKMMKGLGKAKGMFGGGGMDMESLGGLMGGDQFTDRDLQSARSFAKGKVGPSKEAIKAKRKKEKAQKKKNRKKKK